MQSMADVVLLRIGVGSFPRLQLGVTAWPYMNEASAFED